MKSRHLLLGCASALLVFAMILPGAWRVPFYNAPEPLEALVVWEMVETGDWILPRRNGEEIPAKPPLYHWIAAGFSALGGGVSETAVRLPSVLAAAGTAGIVFAAGAAHFGLLAGFAAAVVLSTSPEWVRWSLLARTDALFVLCLTIAFVLGERWLREGQGRSLYGFAAAAGAATLAKGPAGAVLPALVMALTRGLRDRLRATSPLVFAGPILVFLALAGSWYAAAFRREGFGFLQKQILTENVFRFLPSEGGPSREHSVFFYFPMLVSGMFPWSLALPAAFVRAFREDASDRASFSRWLVVWIGVVFVVCSAASGKRTNYILPLYPAAALLIGAWLAGIVEDATEGSSRRLAVVGMFAGGLFSIVFIVLGAWRLGLAPWEPILPLLHVRDREMVPRMVEAFGVPSAWLIATTFAFAIALVVSAWRRHAATSMALCLAAMMLATFVGTAIVRPAEASLRTQRAFAERIAAKLAADEPVRFLRLPEYGVLFYLRRRVPLEMNYSALPRPGWAFVWEEDWNALPRKPRRRAKIVDTSSPVALHRPNSRLHLVRLE